MVPRCLPALLAAVLLAGCQAPAVSPDTVTWVRPGDEAVRIGPPVQADAMRFVRFADIWQREEYGYYDRDGITAEIVFMAADPGKTVALDFRMSTETALRTFTAIDSASPIWQPAEAVPGWRRQLFYRHFTLGPAKRACLGFAGSWDQITEDPDQRPRNALFGYVCQADGTSMPPDVAASIVGAIRVDPSAIWRTPGPSPDGNGEAALSTAHGMRELGNPHFPFRLARFYVIGNGRSGFN